MVKYLYGKTITNHNTMSGSKKNHNTMIFFFFERKKVKPGSIKDTGLTPGWEVQSTTDPLPGFHTDESAAVVSRTM